MGSIRIIWGVEEIMGCYLSGGISLPDSYSPNGTNCTLSAASVQHRNEHMVPTQMGPDLPCIWTWACWCGSTENILLFKNLFWLYRVLFIFYIYSFSRHFYPKQQLILAAKTNQLWNKSILLRDFTLPEFSSYNHQTSFFQTVMT